MTPNQIQRLFPNASKSTLKANTQDSELSVQTEKREDQNDVVRPQFERIIRDATLGEAEAEDRYSERDGVRYHVRITRVSKRLLDDDNLAGKYVADFLRFSGIICNDNPEQTRIENTQRKTSQGEEDHTLVEVFEREG